VRDGDSSADVWRNSLMKSFCEGGMGIEADNVLLSQNRRLLAEARLKYAGRLKDKFLRGPARFLLQDQDPAGIEKLERRLVQEIDAMLLFSCQLWCRHDTPRVRGLHDLTETTFNASRDDIELCQAQAPLYVQPPRGLDTGDAPPGYHDGHSVIMVIQPSVGIGLNPGTGQDAKVPSKVWTKASVLVATPRAPAQQFPAVPTARDSSIPEASSVKATVETPISATPPSVPPKDAQETALILLPSVSFKGISQPVPKQPLSLAASLAELSMIS
jgi:hypothetical protein